MRARSFVLIAALLATATSLPAQTPATPPPAGRPTTAAQRAAAARSQRDSAAADSAAAPIEYRREVYNYGGAARDPFASLLNEAATQTSINDLRLVTVLYDARGGRSVAIIRDRTNPHPYRVRRGESIGRLRVIQIRPYEVVFQVEEFGFERQEVLALQRPEVNR